MRKDPTEFRKRFAAWKNGKQPYKDGLPVYEDGTKTQYSYIIPFIKDKAITLTNAGLATGARLSTNLLDSIADNAERAGLPIETALGIAVKESTLGNPTDDRSMRTLLSKKNAEALKNKLEAYGIAYEDQFGQHINPGNYVKEYELVNYHRPGTETSRDLFKETNTKNLPSILETAFRFYKQHPGRYNPGQKNYQKLVDMRGEETMSSPEIQKWQQERNVKKAVGSFSRVNPLLKESKFNPSRYEDGKLPGYYLGTPGFEEEKTDATTINKPMIVLPIKRDFVAEAQRKHAAEAIGPDTRSSYQRKQSQDAKQYANQQYQKAKDDAKRAEGMDQLMKTISPSTYIEAATGQDLGTVGRLATDVAIFGLPGITKSIAKQGTKTLSNVVKNGGFSISTPRIGKIFGKDVGQFTAWVPFDRPWSKGLSWINTGTPTAEGLPIQYISSKYPGEGLKMYDAVINKAIDEGYPGIITGRELISAPKTYSTLKHHYPNRVKLDDMGHWSNDGMTGLFTGPSKHVYTIEDFLKAVSENPTERVHFLGAPRYRLETPSNLNNNTTRLITQQNASNITPAQWTAAQDAAIARGDMTEAQRLRDLHFTVKAPETKQRTPMFNASGESIFNEFNGGETGLNWFSESEKYASNHGVPRAFYINEPDIYFGNVPAWINRTPANKRYIESLKKIGYSENQIAQKVQEINKAANSTAPAAKSVGMGSNNELVTRNNNTIKLADAVTYDNNGVRIPLGERDNFNINDIRYGIMPLLAGGTGYGLYNKYAKR